MTEQLKRTLGLYGAVASATGLVVASSTLVSQGQGFGLGGPAFVIPVIIAAIMNLFVAFSFGELSAIMPRAGGISYYTDAAMGPVPAVMVVLSAYLIGASFFAGGAEASIPGLIVNQFFPSIPAVVFSMLMVIALIIVNILGVTVFNIVQIITTSIMMLSIAILGIIGLTGISVAPPFLQVWQNFNPIGGQLLALTGLAFWLFVGVEFVTPLAEEVKNPRRTIPLAMALAIGTIFVADLIYGFASLEFVPLDKLAGSVSPHVDAAGAIMGPAGAAWMTIISIFATISTINTLISSIPRILYGMALTGQFPKVFAKIHPRFKTPWVAILLEGIVLLIPISTGIATIESVVTFVLAGAIAWLIAYIVAHLDVIILRFKYPQVTRSYKAPLYPVAQIIGIVLMIYVVLNIFPDPVVRNSIYLYALSFYILTGLWSVIWVKFVMKKSLFKPAPLEEFVEEPDILGIAGTGVPASGPDKGGLNL